MFDKDYWSGILVSWWQILVLVICILVVLGATIAIITIIARKRGDNFTVKTRDLTYGAICVAASFALSYIKFFKMPYGGSITAASTLPMLIYCYYFGFRKGLLVSSVFMLLQLIQEPYIISPWSALLDYFLPYLALSLVGLFRFKRSRYDKAVKAGKNPLCAHTAFFAGTAVYMVVRLFSHVLAGVLFWANGIDFMGWTGDLTGAAAWGYSLTYNALFIVPDTAIALVAGILLLASKAFNRFMASSADTLQNTHPAAENNEGTASGTDKG